MPQSQEPIFTHGSLFSGIGGFDLAAQWMGWHNAFHCEIDPFGQKILKYYWPCAKSYADITTTDFSEWRGKIDILTGGFPCQPYSTAGLRKGTDDSRHLWPHMLRAIQEIRPTWIVGENVLGLVNWNEGMVFNEVHADLEIEGYEVQSFVLPACGINAPHKRERVWIVAYSENNRCGRWQDADTRNAGELYTGQSERHKADGGEPFGRSLSASHAHGQRCTERHLSDLPGHTRRHPWVGSSQSAHAQSERLQERDAQQSRPDSRSQRPQRCDGAPGWQSFPTQSPVCFGDDGLSGKLDGIAFPSWRNASIKGAGNAIVPGIALKLFQAVEAWELLYT